MLPLMRRVVTIFLSRRLAFKGSLNESSFCFKSFGYLYSFAWSRSSLCFSFFFLLRSSSSLLGRVASYLAL